MEYLEKTNFLYIFIGLILVILFVSSESVIIKYLLNILHCKVPMKHCLKYSFIGFFFSCITPSASGGQPAQIYYMKKEGISIPQSTIVLMLVTIEYKFVLVFIGLLLCAFGQSIIINYLGVASFYFYLGLALNIFCVGAMMVLVFQPKLAKFLMLKGCRLLEKIKLLRPKPSRIESLSKSMDKYHESAGFISQHKMAMFNVFILSFIQRVFLFVITYLMYKALGLSGYGLIFITILNSVISIAVDMLPLPGGMGISEHLFLIIFTPIFGSLYTLPGLLLSRGLSFYALVIISAIVTCYSHITITRAYDKKNRRN